MYVATLTDDILNLLPEDVRLMTFRNDEPLGENADSRLKAVDIVSIKTIVEAIGDRCLFLMQGSALSLPQLYSAVGTNMRKGSVG